MTCEQAEGVADQLKGEGRFEEAADTWENIIAACGESAGRFSALGVCRWHAGDVPAGEAAFLRAVELDPERASAYANLASMTFMDGNIGKAEERAKDCIKVAEDVGMDGVKGGCERLLAKITVAKQTIEEQERLLKAHLAE
eukprot:CAMPEP_0173440078 /NCGR_PEP_ID=MMETSP1357-20121228/22212_1 /TAXON_ID=77926 /ORGANISM="Hemiselmis rufescens, Strain PCC563" /LENGTH=140 /DNA_ID=CAMNT_0014405525 /DNA_START=25 /DNA_END=444 /DNA_ORIENTATION=-